MNIITGSAAAPTMSSTDLVEFINKHREQEAQEAGKPFPSKGHAELRHRDFMAKVPEVLGAEVCEKFRAPMVNMQNQQEYSIFVFPKREACLMAMSYSYDLQAKVFDRMTALEQAAAPAPLDLSNPYALRAALLTYSEKVIALETKVAADAPKVAFAETIRAIDGVCHIEKIGKTIGIGRTKFFKRLRDDAILMKNNLPYQKYIDKGYFTVIEQEPYTDSKGVSHPTFTAMVTGAGQVFLAKRYAKVEVAA